MIKEFVDLFMVKKPDLEVIFKEKHPDSYHDIVKAVVTILSTDDYESIDPNRIHEIDDGDCQGTLLYVIADTDCQPSDYWYVKVHYGSCTVCDTLQAINDSLDDKPPTDEQVKDYMALALHIVQGLRKMGDEVV